MERWQNIRNYEGLYQISDCGRVKSLRRNKILRHRVNKRNGYCQICL